MSVRTAFPQPHLQSPLRLDHPSNKRIICQHRIEMSEMRPTRFIRCSCTCLTNLPTYPGTGNISNMNDIPTRVLRNSQNEGQLLQKHIPPAKNGIQEPDTQNDLQ